MVRDNSRAGFTLIELILAIAFVSVLLLAVSVLTIRVGNMYEKGATIRSINQVGREVMDVMRRDFAQASDEVSFKTTTSAGLTSYSICLGSVSYIANSSAALIAREESATLTDLAMVQDSDEPIRLVRVADQDRVYCSEDRGEYLKQVDPISAAELLTSSTMKLAIHDMSVNRIVQGANQDLYRVALVIGTSSKGTIDDNHRCRVSTSGSSEDADADYNYCSVAELTTIMRTGGSL